MEKSIEYLKDKEEIEKNDYENFVLDFTASWCGPCQVIAPHFETLSKEDDFKHIKFYKVDVDENEELCQEYDISCMPTFVFLKDKKKIDLHKGADIKKLREKLQQHFCVSESDDSEKSDVKETIISEKSSETVVEG